MPKGILVGGGGRGEGGIQETCFDKTLFSPFYLEEMKVLSFSRTVQAQS